MPFLFLSPSTQTYNPYLTEGNEQLWMNRLADRMEPMLRASGVNVVRNDPNGSAAKSIRDSNAGAFDFHLALHSNAAPAQNAGRMRGVDIYYYPTSEAGLRMASLIVDDLRPVYPLPELVRALPTTAIGEVRRTRAPGVLCELGYHDNEQDEAWLTGSLDAVARALSVAVTQYFGLPYLAPDGVRSARVQTDGGRLNLRALPEPDAPILAQIPNGSELEIYARFDRWYTAGYGGLTGFVRAEYVRL